MSDALEQSRETNSRLNRRVQELEGPMTSMVSKALHETHQALLQVRIAQEANRLWAKQYGDACTRERWASFFAGIFFLWAVAATMIALVAWLAMR